MYTNLYFVIKNLLSQHLRNLLILLVVVLVIANIAIVRKFIFSNHLTGKETNQQQLDSKLAKEIFLEANKVAQEKHKATLPLALEKYEKAFLLSSKANDKQLEVDISIQEVKAYLILEKYTKALEVCQRIEPFIADLANPRTEAEFLSSKGAIYLRLEQIEKALNYLNKALKIFEALLDKYQIALTDNIIGECYLTVGILDQAQKKQGEALTILHSLYNQQGNYTQQQIDTEVIQTFKNLGDIFGKENDPKSVFYLDLALRLLSRSAKNDYQKATILSDLGSATVLTSKEQDFPLTAPKAIAYLQQAFDLFGSVGDTTYQGRVLAIIAGIYDLKLDDKPKALEYSYRALEFFPENKQTPISWRSDLFYEIAYDEFKLKNFEVSKKYNDKCLQLCEQRWANSINSTLRQNYSVDLQYVYNLYIKILMSLHKEHPNAGYDIEAFQFSELSKSKNFANALTEANADIRKGVSKKLLDLEKQLNNQISDKKSLYIKLSQEKQNDATISLLKKVEKERDEAVFKLQEILADIRQESVQYTTIAQPKPLTLKEIQQQLDPDTVLLEYKFLQGFCYLWTITQSSFNSYSLENPEKITNLAQKLYKQLFSLKADNAQNPQNLFQEKDYLETSFDLSKLVLTPIADKIKGKRLLVVSDNVLQYVPFAILINPNAEKQNPSATLLIESNEIINLPSIAILPLLRKAKDKRPPAPMSALIVADPVFDFNDVRLKKEDKTNKDQNEDLAKLMPQVLRGSHFGRLDHSRSEAKAITSNLPNKSYKLLLDFDSSRENILKEDLTKYQILAFITHGLLDTGQVDASGLILSCIDKNGNFQNGFLGLYDIYNLKLSSDLVVLSACQTGLGKEIWGEGFANLTRGFMYAGASRVIASLWSVDDAATSELMKIFYEKLITEKKRPAEALRLAQLEMMRTDNYHHPFFWAAFTLQGEWR